MSRPLISQANIWDNFKKDIFQLIREALILLQDHPNLPEIEDNSKKNSLNRELYKCFRRVAHKRGLSYHLPVREGKNPPYAGDVQPTEHENKIPDFYWQFMDNSGDEDNCEKRFILECKRLGKSKSAGWQLNENYVQKGIRRFITAPHEYGKGDDTGGMVGYVQNMEFNEILNEVNITTRNTVKPIPDLKLLSKNWKKNGVSELGHKLTRDFPLSPYSLHHFWVDLRDSY